MTLEAVPTTESAAAQISTRMVQLMSQHTGRGPTRARTTMNTNLIVVVLEDALTRPELNLVRAGEGESVSTQRRLFQRVMRDEAVAAVEELTGRRVLSYMSDLDPENNVAAVVFVLEELPETGAVAVAEVAPANPAP